MSEFQYYEFRALDRPLSRDEQAQLRAISTRADITSRSFVNTYEWGDLKADPEKLVARYFDVHIYAANWGHNRVMYRFPRALVDEEQLALYCGKNSPATLLRTGEFLVVDLNTGEESESEIYVDVDQYAEELVSLRDDILRGDLRALYLGWLVEAQNSFDEQNEELEPPVPPGLGELTDALETLAEFLGIDSDLFEVAAEASAPPGKGEGKVSPQEAEEEALRKWVLGKRSAERDQLLVRFLGGEDVALRRELLQQFRKESRPKADGKTGKSRTGRPQGTRTIGQLLAAAEDRRQERLGAEEENRARAREAAARKAAEERRNYLQSLTTRIGETWKQIETLVQSRTPRSYDQAVKLLQDLRDLAAMRNKTDSFLDQLDALRHAHAGKSSFLERLDKAGLRASG